MSVTERDRRRNLPRSLADELVKVAMAPAAVAHLAALYHRSIVRRLLQDDVLTDAPIVLGWLHPRLVWRARVDLEGLGANIGGLAALLNEGAGELKDVPAPEHIGRNRMEPWSDWAVRNTERYGQELEAATSLRIMEDPVDASAERISRAMALLRSVWPEIAVENALLIRAFIHVVGDLNSASFEDVFGAVVVERRACASETAAFEMLLHEGGHHSLFLREAFDPFVENGDTMARHPLREDERPIRGPPASEPLTQSREELSSI